MELKPIYGKNVHKYTDEVYLTSPAIYMSPRIISLMFFQFEQNRFSKTFEQGDKNLFSSLS